MPKITIVSAAPSAGRIGSGAKAKEARATLAAKGLDVWDERDIDRRAIERNTHGEIVRGSFGFHFNCSNDLSKFVDLKPEHLVDGIVRDAKHLPRGDGSVNQITPKMALNAAKQLVDAYGALKKGVIVGLKVGTQVFAIVEITSDYTFSPEQPWGWHSWSYRVLKRVTLQPLNGKGLVKTVAVDWPAEGLA